MVHVAWYMVKKCILALVWNQYTRWLWPHEGRNAHVKKPYVDRTVIKAISLYKIAFLAATDMKGVRRSEVGWGTALQATRSPVLFPMGVIGILYWLNPSGRTMALGSTQPKYQGYFPGGKGGRCVGLTNVPPWCANCLEILGTATSWSIKGLFMPVMGRFTFLHTWKITRYMLKKVRKRDQNHNT